MTDAMNVDEKREFLLGLVRKIMDFDGTEDELTDLLNVFSEHIDHPAGTGLIYHPPGGKELTPEEIVDVALSYKPLQIG